MQKQSRLEMKDERLDGVRRAVWKIMEVNLHSIDNKKNLSPKPLFIFVRFCPSNNHNLFFHIRTTAIHNGAFLDTYTSDCIAETFD